MDENRISCPVGSVTTSSLNQVVVPDNLFSPPINIVPSTTDYVTMSGGEEAPHMFPTPQTHDNQLQPSYDRNVPKYPNEQLDHRRHRNRPSLTPAWFTVFEYMDRLPESIDALRSRWIPTEGNEPVFLIDWGLLDTAAEPWSKRWNDWGGCSAL